MRIGLISLCDSGCVLFIRFDKSIEEIDLSCRKPAEFYCKAYLEHLVRYLTQILDTHPGAQWNINSDRIAITRNGTAHDKAAFAAYIAERAGVAPAMVLIFKIDYQPVSKYISPVVAASPVWFHLFFLGRGNAAAITIASII